MNHLNVEQLFRRALTRLKENKIPQARVSVRVALRKLGVDLKTRSRVHAAPVDAPAARGLLWAAITSKTASYQKANAAAALRLLGSEVTYSVDDRQIEYRPSDGPSFPCYPLSPPDFVQATQPECRYTRRPSDASQATKKTPEYRLHRALAHIEAGRLASARINIRAGLRLLGVVTKGEPAEPLTVDTTRARDLLHSALRQTDPYRKKADAYIALRWLGSPERYQIGEGWAPADSDPAKALRAAWRALPARPMGARVWLYRAAAAFGRKWERCPDAQPTTASERACAGNRIKRALYALSYSGSKDRALELVEEALRLLGCRPANANISGPGEAERWAASQRARQAAKVDNFMVRYAAAGKTLDNYHASDAGVTFDAYRERLRQSSGWFSDLLGQEYQRWQRAAFPTIEKTTLDLSNLREGEKRRAARTARDERIKNQRNEIKNLTRALERMRGELEEAHKELAPLRQSAARSAVLNIVERADGHLLRDELQTVRAERNATLRKLGEVAAERDAACVEREDARASALRSAVRLKDARAELQTARVERDGARRVADQRATYKLAYESATIACHDLRNELQTERANHAATVRRRDELASRVVELENIGKGPADPAEATRVARGKTVRIGGTFHCADPDCPLCPIRSRR
jgi:hypothetical protein